MIGWSKINLGDLATFHNGYAFKPEDWSTSGKEIIRIQNLTKGSAQINYFQGEIADKYKVRHDDVLISWSGSLGVYIWHGKDAWLNQHLFKVVFNKENLDKSFFIYLISNSLKKLEAQVHGATMKHITKKKFDAFPVNLPPLEQQKKIAAILDAANAYRQKTKALIEKYDELTQSLFLDMFGEKGKYKQEIIENLVTKITDGTHHTPKYTDSGVPFLRVTDITKSNKSKKYITYEEHAQLIKRCNPQKGDVLYTKNGTIGIAKLVDWDYEFSIFVSLCLLKPKNDIINNKFLESFLNTPFALKQAMRHSKTGTITNLHLVEIKKIKIPLPEMNTQMEFVNKVSVIEKQKAQAEASLAQAEGLFNSLLQRAFKGELTN